MTNVLSLLAGWVLDLAFGDPPRLPHPVVWFGRVIAFCEHRLNRGWQEAGKSCQDFQKSRQNFSKSWQNFFLGGLTSVVLTATVFLATLGAVVLLRRYSPFAAVVVEAVLVFYCLAGTTLIREVREVFRAVDRSLADGRKQVSRIVGRDTRELSAQEVRTAALETLAENLSDGVVAPLFWLALLGTPGMMAYKMVNTLDSMIGYRTPRYRQFGCVAARLDDAANYLPARLTALLMIAGYALARTVRPSLFPSGRRRGLAAFVRRYGREHASPNSGYPEAALAAILDCRFGGPHHYFGQLFDKPYIGHNDRPLTTADMRAATCVNRAAELLMVGLTATACLAASLLA